MNRVSKPKELTGALFFSANAPHVIGHLSIGDVHFELVGIRRSETRTDFTGRRHCNEQQQDLFDGQIPEGG
jgi:hypothetical protein